MLELSAETVSAVRDDETLRYVVSVRAPFEALRRVATQLAGFALLHALGSGRESLQDAPVKMARTALEDAEDALRSLRPTAAASHYHHHLMQACRALAAALDAEGEYLIAARRTALAAASEPALKRAVEHLRHASAALPGFEIVDLGQACCAFHPGAGQSCRPEGSGSASNLATASTPANAAG